MNLSHKLTFSLVFSVLLIVGCAFLITPAMAHNPADQTYDQAHDGMDADGNTNTAAALAETDHTHTGPPTITSIELVDVMGAEEAGGTLVSNVGGITAVLVNDVTAEAATRVVIRLADNDSDPNTAETLAAGQIQLRITFSGPVYAAAGADANTAPVAGATDLAATDFTATATEADAPGVNVAGTRLGTFVVARIDPTPDDTATNDLSLTEFLVTIPVTASPAGLTAAELPLSIYINVAEDALYSATRLVNGQVVFGRGNAASMNNLFEVVATLDSTAPMLTVGDGMLGDDGNLTYMITADEMLASGDNGLTADDIMVTGGEVVSLTQDGLTYTLVVMPTDMYTNVSVTVTAAGVMDRSGNAVAADVMPTNQYTAPARPFSTDTGTDGQVRMQANSFVVVVRNADSTQPGAGGLAFRDDVQTAVWAGMPDLQNLFDRTAPHGGGAIILRDAGSSPALAVGTVGISEIMWAVDNSYFGNATAEKASQWIELHNLKDHEVTVSLSTLMGTAITDNANGLRGGLTAPIIDAVTNFFNNRPGNGAWDVKGSSGDSVQARDFVAMGRIRPDADTGGGVRLEPYRDAANVRYNNRDGRAAGNWNAFSTTYLVSRTTGGAEYKYIGTPGRVNDFAPQTQGDLVVGRNHKPAANTIVINEVGNNSNDAYDWIEIRNASGNEINLRNYIITKVTAVDTETVMARFPANDNIKLKPNEVFLLLRTDPADDQDHPIAATGWNVDKPEAEQVPGTKNSPVRYKVYNHNNFSIPNDTANNGPNIVIMVRRPDNHENFASGANGGKGAAETGNSDLEKIVDIAGYHNNLGKNPYPNSVSRTSLWPLYSFDPPNFSNNRFDVNTVHQRNRTGTNNNRAGVGAQDNNNGKTAFGDRGWTGVGYRLATAQTAMHGGTPGYPNGAAPRSGDAITGPVYISEIMYADDTRGSLAQWIELRNPSNTMGADLTNWRLTITNHDSMNEAGDAFTGTTHTEDIMLNGLEIPPNSSVLITSRKGPRDDVHLPDDQIFVLYPAHRSALGMVNATSDILNPYGFNIRIQANAHDKGKRGDWQMVDEVGNLAARRTANRGERTDTERFDDPRWMLPNALTAAGARISIARTNMRGGTKATGFTRADGKEASGWILSNMDGRTDLVSPTYYGHRDDWGTPGQTVGQPLPVELSFFRPTLENGKVTIRWTTESELDNAGFNILRSETRRGEFTKVNEQMIQGKGTTAERSSYTWVDTTAKPGVVYYYQIEDVTFAGQHNILAVTKLKGLISAQGKLTTQWGELKNLR